MKRQNRNAQRLVAAFSGAFLLVPALANAAGASPEDKDQLLIQAAKDDDLAAVRSLIARHADVNVEQGDGFTPLHWATYNDDVALTQLLLHAGAKPEARTRLEGDTPLYLAARNGDAKLIEVLLSGGASTKTTNDNGTTPLMEAAAAGTPAAVETLLAHGADVNAREKTYGQTALFFAVSHDRGEAVQLLIAKGADTTVKTNIQKLERITVNADGEEVPADGKTVADGKDNATGGNARPRGGNRQRTEGEEGKTAAAFEGDVLRRVDQADKTGSASGEKSLAADKGDPAKKDEPDAYGFTRAERAARVYGSLTMGGLTPLHVAARDGQLNAIKALLEEHADINAVTDTDKSTPLLLAIINGHYDAAKYILDHGADAKLASTDGLGPIYAAIDVQWSPHTWYPQPVTAQEKTTYLELIDALLAKGADVNAKLSRKLWFRVFANDETWVDVTGVTAFWRAAYAGDLAAMQVLAKHGADTNVLSKSNDSPLMVAAGLGWAAYWTANAPYSRLDAVKFCLDHGADINLKDIKGYTAIHGAAFRGDDEMIQYLLAHGADLNVVSKQGDTVADSANGLFEHATPHPETVALLEKLGSKSSNNCRSNDCVVPPKPDRPAGFGRPGVKPAAAATPDTPTAPESK